MVNRGVVRAGASMALLAIVVAVIALQAAVPGQIDATYGTDGITRVPYGAYGTTVAASVQQPDGKMVVAGTVAINSWLDPYTNSTRFETDAVVMRFTPGGALDTSFGTNGITTFDLGSRDDYVVGVALDPSQDPANPRIVVAGTFQDPTFSRRRFGAARLSAGGVLDADFGAGGIASTDFVVDPNYFWRSDAEVSAVAVQADGKIVLGGMARDESTADTTGFGFAITRLDQNGARDGTFTPLRQFLDAGPYAMSWVTALAIDADGSIVAAGQRYDVNGQRACFLARLPSTGGTPSLVQSLAITNTAAITLFPPSAGAAEGDILVAGTLNRGLISNPQNDFALERRHPDGAADAGFGAGGLAWIDSGGTQDVGLAMAIHPSGAIIVAGSAGPYGPAYFGVARFLPSGAPDTTFGETDPASFSGQKRGFQHIDIGESADTATGVGLQGDRIVLAGTYSDGTWAGGVALARVFSICPVVTIGTAQVPEGNAGDNNAGSVPVTLDRPSSDTITVDYETYVWEGAPWVQGIPGTDYEPASGTLTFTPGETSKSVAITVHGNTLYEGGKYVFVRLKNASEPARIDPAQNGTLLIADDDPMPMISIGDLSVTEGNSGTTQATLTVTMTAMCGSPTGFSYVTMDGTATAGSDYTTTYGSATIPAGQTSTTVSVPIIGDLVPEPDRIFQVKLIGIWGVGFCGAGYDRDIANVTILDDDRLAIAGASPEGTAVDRAAVVSVQFSSPVDPATLLLTVEGEHKTERGIVACNDASACTVATFTPRSKLTPGKSYTATVSARNGSQTVTRTWTFAVGH